MEYNFALSYSVSVKSLSILLHKTTCVLVIKPPGALCEGGGAGAGLDVPRSLVSNESAVDHPKLKVIFVFCFQLGVGSNDNIS